MRTVLVNVSFRDKYTNEMYEAGKTYSMSEERIKEVKEVNPDFITVIGTPEVKEEPEVGEEGTEEEGTEEEGPKKRGKK